MKRVLDWLSKHKKAVVLFCCILVFLPIITIHTLFKIKTDFYWIQADWESGDVLGYFGDVLSFVGTIILGFVAIIQTEKANNLSEDLLNIERNKIKPCIDIESSHLYKIYLSDDIYKQFDKIDRSERMTIEILYTQNPRTGITTDCALIELEISNSGGSDISQIYIKNTECYLCVNDPNDNHTPKIPMITGNTGLKIGERKILYIYIKREINTSADLYDTWYSDNCKNLMPHVEFDLELETSLGEVYSEKISFGSGWDASMKNSGTTIERELGIINRKISLVTNNKI